MNEKKGGSSRRKFLLAMGAGSAAGAAAMVAKTAPRPQAVAAESQTKRRTRGYQASAHVRSYYRTAKV